MSNWAAVSWSTSTIQREQQADAAKSMFVSGRPIDQGRPLLLINLERGIMASEVDELTVEWEEDGLVTVKELDKVVLTKGAWATLIFKYQDWDRRKEEYGPEKFTIRRYQKRDGQYSPRSKFNISSADQARKIIAALHGWIGEEE